MNSFVVKCYMPLIKVYVIALLLLFVVYSAGCTKEESIALKKTGRINDFASALSADTHKSLSSDLEKYERETCHQIVVLIVPSLQGETIKDLSTRTALSWEIGNQILNNGILLSVAIDEGQARIEVGSALETIIEQGMGENILKNEMFPSFRDQNMDKGIIQGVRAIMDAARELEIPDELKPTICRQE